MKSFFTKLGGLLLCGVMFTAVGCHDYAEDIKKVNDRVDAIDGALNGTSEGVATELAALKATVAALDATYATEAELSKAVGDLQTSLEGKISAAVKEATDAVAALTEEVGKKATKEELTAKEAELDAKIGELRAAMESAKTEMQSALAVLDAKFVKLEVYNAAITEINGKLDGIADTYLTKDAYNTSKATLDAAIETLEGDVSAIEGALEDKADAADLEALSATVATVSGSLATLSLKVDGLVSTLETAQENIKANADAIEEMKGNLETEVSELEAAIALKADKTALDEAVDAINGEIDAIKAAAETLEATVALKANQADLEAAKTALQAAIDAKADATVVEALAGRVDTIEDNIETIEADLETAKADLQAAIDLKADKTALDEVQTALETAIAAKVSQEDYDAKVEELTGEIAEKVAQTDFDAAVTNLQNQIDALGKDAADALEKRVLELKENMRIMHEEIANTFQTWCLSLQDSIDNLAARVVVTEEQIAQLFARIQSVVFKPTHSHGDALVSYSTAGKEYLEGLSTITYKVYPASCVETIVNAFNAADDAQVKLDLSFDAIQVKSAAAGIEVVGAAQGVNEQGEAIPGDLCLTYKPNLGKDFYTGDVKYAAALVLAFNGENAQNFSTEYTNFVADRQNAKDWKMVLYVGDKPFVKGDESYNVTWPYVETGKNFRSLLPELNVKFTDGTKDYEPSELVEMGYDVECKKTVDVTVSDKLALNYEIDNTDEKNPIAKVSPSDPASIKYIGANAEALYSYVWNGMIESASAKAIVEDFGYKFAIKAPAYKEYFISYVDKAKEVKVLDGLVKLLLVDKEGNEVEVDEFIAEKKELGYDYSSLVVKCGWSYGEDYKRFNIVANSDSYKFPATVSLKEDVTLEDVGKRLSMTYKFSMPVIESDVLTASAVVKIDPPTYDYAIEDQTITWNYMADAAADADNTLAYERSLEGVTVVAPEVVDDTEFSKIWDLQKNRITYTVDGEASQDVEILPVEGDNTKANVKFRAFEWGKKYLVAARVEVINANGKIASVVNVKFNVETVDRDREAVYTLDLTDTDAVDYNNSYELKANLVLTNELSNPTAGVCQIPEVNQGEGFEVAKWLEDVFVTNAPIKVVNTIKFGETEVNPTSNSNGFTFNEDGSAVYTAFHYNSRFYKPVMPTELTLVKELTTYYGQKVVITSPLSLIAPDYTIKHSEFYVKNVDGVYQSFVEGSYKEEGGKVTDFSVNNINMNDAFFLYDGDTPLTAEEIAEKGLSWIFDVEEPEVEEGTALPQITDNVISYVSPVDYVGVTSELYLVNKVDGAEISRILLPTNFEETYGNYIVNKYDPLLDLQEVAPVVKTLNGTGVYTANLAEELNLNDKVGREFIVDGEYNADAYVYDNNYYGLELIFDVDAAKAQVPFELSNSVVIETASANGHVIDCIVQFNYSTDLQIQKGFDIKVPVTYKYFWGETSTEITVKFELPAQN